MTTKQDIREYFAKFGKEGGKARAKKLTPEQRSESARKAVMARWAKSERRWKKTQQQIDDLEKRNRANTRKARARKKQADGG